MELKQGNERFEMNLATLLIVPYGIETITHIITVSRQKLLIVPYGIETKYISLYSLTFKLF